MKRRLRVIGFDNVQLKDPKCKLILAEAWEKRMPCETCWQLDDCIPHCKMVREWMKNNPWRKKC